MQGFSLKRIFLLATLLGALLSIAVMGAILQLRAEALSEAESSSTALSTLLAEQARHSSQAIDLAINEIDGALAAETPEAFRAKATALDTARNLNLVAAKRAAIDLISIEDAEGALVFRSRGAGPFVVGAGDRFFDFLKNNRTRDTFIGAPHVSEATGAVVADFVRRLEAPDGRFLGIARVSVETQLLISNYANITSLAGRSYALFSRDGVLLARYPEVSSPSMAKLPPNAKWFEVVANGGGVYRALSSFDQQPRIVATRPIPFSMLVVAVSVSEEAALVHWREQASAIATCALIALMIAVLLTESLLVQFRKLADKEASLRAKSHELELSNTRFATALGNMSQGLVVFDKDANVVISNERYAAIYGLAPESIPPGTSARAILDMRVQHGVYAGPTPESYIQYALGRRFSDQRIDYLSDGRAILVNHAVCPDGGLVATHEDVTERETANARLAHMAMHDPLTQLANRSLFMHALAGLQARIGAGCDAIVVMLIDLDDFKPINDTHGHAAGDALLKECATRLLATAPDAEVIARLGGDEFAIAYGAADADPEGPCALAQSIVDAVSRPYLQDGQTLVVGACVGVGLYTDPSVSLDDVIRRTDLALYSAKAAASNHVRLFEPQLELATINKRELAADLAHAIATDGLELHYQPIVDAQTLEIRQMEALVRWNHPRRGRIMPQDFIGLAEETRLINDLGAWVVRRACADAARWPEHVSVAVNVSPVQLSGADMTGSVVRALESAGISARRLELEITESALLQENGDDLAALRRLKEIGVSIALDDFGTGFSSMSYLKRFPFDKLKIDRCFVADVMRDPGSAAIVAATVRLAQAFDIEVTAEGVETPEQYDALRKAGAHLIQGYLFGRPAPVRDGLPAIDIAMADGARPIGKVA